MLKELHHEKSETKMQTIDLLTIFSVFAIWLIVLLLAPLLAM